MPCFLHYIHRARGKDGGRGTGLGRTKGVRHQAKDWAGSLAEERREKLKKGEQKTKWWERRWEGRKPLTWQPLSRDVR